MTGQMTKGFRLANEKLDKIEKSLRSLINHDPLVNFLILKPTTNTKLLPQFDNFAIINSKEIKAYKSYWFVACGYSEKLFFCCTDHCPMDQTYEMLKLSIAFYGLSRSSFLDLTSSSRIS